MKKKSGFFCTDCGVEYLSWQGRCSGCGAWNTIAEAPKGPAPPRGASSRGAPGAAGTARARPRALSEIDDSGELRIATGLNALARVLGGGVVLGSLVLVGGAPGIGKSTLLLQICEIISKNRSVLYVSGEESEHQIKLRAARLGVKSENVLLLTETDINEVLAASEETKPDILIVDSIQTLYNPDIGSAPGSVGQVKDCAMSLLRLAKSTNVTVLLVGHVNKEGAIAGPMVLEHMGDCVLSFEGEVRT
ncbi:MAG: DNA repair protein RadA, partial [Clostridiales bacterium]|nr:DNA repair protein RadA [Clostridiales bacterium]